MQSYTHTETWGRGIRVVIPSFIVAFSWTLATVFNMRTAVVTADRVLPVAATRSTAARCDCAARATIVNYEDGQDLENFYSAGVETGSQYYRARAERDPGATRDRIALNRYG